jgi:hypothetical protein
VKVYFNWNESSSYYNWFSIADLLGGITSKVFWERIFRTTGKHVAQSALSWAARIFEADIFWYVLAAGTALSLTHTCLGFAWTFAANPFNNKYLAFPPISRGVFFHRAGSRC